MNSKPETGKVERAVTAFHEFVRCGKAIQFAERGRDQSWVHMDMTMAQFRALMLIASTGGVTGRALAERLGIGPSAVTPLVDRLVMHGYVRREEDHDDRRLSWARPTAAGHELLQQVMVSGKERMVDLLTHLTEEEMDVVDRAFQILRHAAEQQLARHQNEQESLAPVGTGKAAVR